MNWYWLIGEVVAIIIVVYIVMQVGSRKIKRHQEEVVSEYDAMLLSITETPVAELQPLVEQMLTDPAMFTVRQEDTLTDEDKKHLAPLLCSFFTRYAQVKNIPLNYELSPVFLAELAPAGWLLIGKDDKESPDHILIYAVEGSEQIVARGDDYADEFASIYHFIYAQKYIR